jgi:hypothetical protein
VAKSSCSDATSCEYVVGSSTNELVAKTLEVNIYPNPTKNAVNVDFGNQSFEGELSIINTQGQLVFARTIQNEKLVDIELDLASGVYFIQFIDEDQKHTFRKPLIIN